MYEYIFLRFKLEFIGLSNYLKLPSVPQQRQAALNLPFGWFVPPAGDFGLGPKVTKSPPKAFPLGYLPFREQNCSCGTFPSRRRCSCPAAASANQNSKHCVSLGVPRFCVESQLSAAPRELVGNRQDNQRTGGENLKRGLRPSLCRFRSEGFLKGRGGIESSSPL